MSSRICALLLGVVYLLFGIMGLFDPFVSLPPDRLRFYNMQMLGDWGFLFGWMPVNLVHDVLYILIGAGGVLGALTFSTARSYCRGIFVITCTFTIIGLLPLGADRLWGLLPLFSWNLMFHGVTAMLAYYYGIVYPLDLGGPEPATQWY